MTYRWLSKAKPNPATIEVLRQALNISNTLCEILANRGVTDFDSAKTFFRPQLSMLHDPFLMKDMQKAVTRIQRAIDRGEKIMVYGDYDVDGTTAVSVLFDFLKKHYPNVTSYIPDRYKEGYGISLAGIDFAQQENCRLIVALDCGIKALKQVEYAQERNIDFIICDHHRPGEKLPGAHAILNPKQIECSYPFDELSGCGVGFKLVQALCSTWQLPDDDWEIYLDLLAVSIGSDIVPMVGENRVLAYFGLKKINENPSPGIRWLKINAGKEKD